MQKVLHWKQFKNIFGMHVIDTAAWPGCLAIYSVYGLDFQSQFVILRVPFQIRGLRDLVSHSGPQPQPN